MNSLLKKITTVSLAILIFCGVSYTVNTLSTAIEARTTILQQTLDVNSCGDDEDDGPKSIYQLNTIPEGQSRAFQKIGIDVSYHNKEIDWQAVKDSGVDFAIIRTSYGWSDWTKQTDEQLKNNIAGAKAVGIPIGAYHCSYAKNRKEASLEADFFIDRLKWAQWEYPVFIDIEAKCQCHLTRFQRTEVILTFLHKLKKAGYYTGFYANLHWTTYLLDMNRLRGHELWIARWNKTCGCIHTYGIWQFTSKGDVPGIEGDVDMNLCYVDYPTIIKNAHLNGF